MTMSDDLAALIAELFSDEGHADDSGMVYRVIDQLVAAAGVELTAIQAAALAYAQGERDDPESAERYVAGLLESESEDPVALDLNRLIMSRVVEDMGMSWEMAGYLADWATDAGVAEPVVADVFRAAVATADRG